MHAVVLVGGFGTRLRPLTDDIPKPMLPIGHVPMIVRLVDRLVAGGIREVVLALGFLPDPFEQAFPGGRHRDTTVRYAVEPEPLDTAGAIRFAADAAGIDATFVVANGDVQTDLDIAAFVAAHRQRPAAEATIHLVTVDDPSAFGVVDIHVDGQIASFVEKPAPDTEPSSLANAGTYVFEPEMLDRIQPGVASSIERDVFPAVAAAGRLFGVATDDYWTDTGRPELYVRANLDLLDGVRQARCEPLGAGVVLDPTAVVEHSVIGDGAVVGPGATVVDSVLLPGARIGAHAVVRRSAVRGRVAAGAVVSDALVADPSP